MITAYHFVGKMLRDGRPIPKDGEWLIHTGPVQMCASGLHASRHPFDALKYAPGSTICRVELENTIQEDPDKLVATRRRILWRYDMTAELRKFACDQALAVLPDNAPDVLRQYLMTCDERLRDAARAVAWDAARAVAWDAAWAAAWAAARAAARAAAWDAARDAAWAAAWAAARQSFQLVIIQLEQSS